ncbi:unnamed protein product (macronuclear) [Paramecium tetraurelia]|uniref:Transmembrane protein n=1 Tax=Paramecium tetraurelia TaxID=5888 RepID=A0DXA1_PARTE|nr:uncharacterized protein GSPATT00021300001 [Paramecium tetraurelia]CAK87668.1 unnamed protein product [Paramecium tetraurelia]|eukprot:XP_001455065.1 hypothetical protein (macronuclear) [Paramecium tetraurelia strain d4-2]
MNSIIIKNKLRALYVTIRESKSQSYLNPSFIWILYIGTRLGLILRVDQFNGKAYEDKQLELIKNLINWFHFLTPIKSIEVDQFESLVVILIAVIHWLSCLITLFNNNQVRFFNSFQNQYFTYLQMLYLYPSFLHIHQLQYANQDQISVIICTTPIILNYSLFTYIQRNYALPSNNPFTKRYRPYNYLVNLTEIIALVLFPYFDEVIQSIILMIQFLIQVCDSILNQPFPQQINLNYCIGSSILFYCSIFKGLSIHWTEMEFLYFCLIYTPFLTVITKKLIKVVYEQNLDSKELNKFIIIQMVDEFYQRDNNFTHVKILYTLKNRYQILNNSKLRSDTQFNDYIFIMFNRYIDSLPIQEKYKDEDLHTYKIQFLYYTYDKQNLAYIQIKQFQIYQEFQSLYFQILESFCSEIIQRKIKKQIQQNQGRLELQQIRQSQALQEKCQPLIIYILEQKIKYWDQLLNGYENIEQLSDVSVSLSQKVVNLKNIVFKELNIQIFTLQKELFRLNLVDLRLLSQIFATVLNDYHITLQIEQRIEELLNLERNITTRNIQNIGLLNDDVIIIPVSMIKNPGLILSKNKQKLFKFFKYPNEDSYQLITNINSILPLYLQKKHDKFVNQFLQTGESSLFIISQDVYPIYNSGFSFSATLQLIPSYDQIDDYILSAVVKRSTETYDFILFDESGKILGLTESIYQLLLFNSKSQVTSEFDSNILSSYIYFWFKDLLLLINDQQDVFTGQQTQQAALNIQTTIIQPINNLASLIKDHETFRKQHFLTQTHTMKTEQDVQSDLKKPVKITCFESNYVSQTNEFINEQLLKMHQNSVYFQVTFMVHFQKRQDSYPIFLLTINEYLQKEQKYTGSQSAYTSLAKTKTVLGMKSEFQLQTEQDLDELHQEFLINQTIINKLFIKHADGLPDSRDIDQKEEDLNIRNIIDRDQKESNLISPRSNREILIQKGLIEEDSEYIRGNESNVIKSSSQKEIKENIQQAILQEQNVDFAHEKQSKSSATSDKTQNSIYNLMRKLQYTQQFQTSILNVIFLTNILTVFLIILVSVELSIVRDHTNQLEVSIPLVRVPQRFNRLYCTFLTIGQIELQSKLLNQSYGAYYEYRIKNESASKRIEIQALMTEILAEFSSMEEKQQLPIMEIRIINEYVYEKQNASMIEFDNLVNENTDQINLFLQRIDEGNESVKQLQILLQFLKGNLVDQLDLTIAIVNQIENDFYDLISINQIEEIIFLIVMLLTIFVMLLLQFRQWLQPYKYMQTILLLIGKISERDIEYSGARVYFLLEKLNRNHSSWKNINYFREFFLSSKRSATYQTLKIQSSETTKKQNTSKNQQQRAKQISRIQETSFSIKNIQIMLLLLCLLLSIYAISGFIIMKTNMDNSQPELNIAMEYVKFKQDLDGVMIISQLLKIQQILIEETMVSGIFKMNPELSTRDKYFKTLYAELLTQFSPLITDMDEIYSKIYNNVIESKKISEENKQLLLNLYEKDLCEIIPTILPFCAYENDKFEYFSTFPPASSDLNNKQIYKYGINGIYQQQDFKNINQDYVNIEYTLFFGKEWNKRYQYYQCQLISLKS